MSTKTAAFAVLLACAVSLVSADAARNKTTRQIPVYVRAEVKPATVIAGKPIPLFITVTNQLDGSIGFPCYSLIPNNWNGETLSISLVDIYRDGKEFNLYLASPKIEPPLRIAGTSQTTVQPKQSATVQTDAAKWKLRDGWLPGRYKVTVRVDNIRVDDYCTLNVLSDPFEFTIE
ncbi:MAG: hypothetical protein IID46_07460 [Planctomycetes bacterium]|nr:hypothetical protein [Planctomycetota bacterium]